MTTISKTEDRTIKFSGMQEGHAVIIENLSYNLGGVLFILELAHVQPRLVFLRQRSRTIIGLTPDELRKILALAERAPTPK